MTFSSVLRVSTPVLEVAYQEAGDRGGLPVFLLHGFPYDVRAYDEVAGLLADAGLRVIAPYLRGFGETRFRDPGTPRSGQQAALAQDLLELMDALEVERAIVAGYDWGGRAACIAAALWPERVHGLVSAAGYNVQDIANAVEPAKPEWEVTYWYQYYFGTERGRRGLERNRDELCELLWGMWSPTWAGAAAAFPASAPSLHNPDFVEVVIHSYRHRYGLVAGDPQYDGLEAEIAKQPVITVPTVVLESGADGVGGPSDPKERAKFTGPYQQRMLADIGHNVPQEAPAEFARAVLDLVRR
ncbi:alpha/beta fold hydrolase [Kribbella monticola]|uniref:alpha/beta fold hydrolase n=1 Tax=Kribbella monticola TaxID=2185285 RepID=UPI0018E5015A|nr:alpha/beta hydrolase [Kribbella monticola]